MSDADPDCDETQGRRTATYADGYSGWVADLGDGTCRLLNNPLLGDNGPKLGDRVDLFFNPCNAFERPRIGYRIYREGEEPPGRHFARERTPTAEEIEAQSERKREREARQLEFLEERSAYFEMSNKLMDAEVRAADELIRYYELLDFVKRQGLQVPDDLHSKEHRQARCEEQNTPEARKRTKLFMLASARVDYEDVVLTEDEIEQEVRRMREEAAVLATCSEQMTMEADDSQDEEDKEEEFEDSGPQG